MATASYLSAYVALCLMLNASRVLPFRFDESFSFVTLWMLLRLCGVLWQCMHFIAL